MASGQTCSESSRTHGLRPNVLGWWKWKLTREGEQWGSPPVSFAHAEELGFVEITSLVARSSARATEPARLEVCVDDLRVRVPDEFDTSTLSRVLDVLEARR